MKPNEWLFDAIGCVEDSFLDQQKKYRKVLKLYASVPRVSAFWF